jgi:hypothetical protein
MSSSSVVYCLAKDDAHAIRIINRLERCGYGADDVSVLYSDASGRHNLGTENATKAPEGAATGAGTGAVLGGAIGWLAGIGALAIPGVGPLIAAGPIIGTLSGLAVGGTVGGLTGALVGLGIPEYEAQTYEGRLREGNVLISVHADDSDDAAEIRQAMNDEKAESVSTGREAVASSRD